MNKKFIYAALASLAMVGCAKTEGVKPAKQQPLPTISFRAVNTTDTRAVTTIANLNGFYTVGVLNKTTENQFSFLKLSSTLTTDNTWQTDQFWPDGKITFINIGPLRGDGTFSANLFKPANIYYETKSGTPRQTDFGTAASADAAILTFSAGGSNGTTPGATYAQKAGTNDNRDLSTGYDAVVAVNSGTGDANGTSGVALNFKHIYSQIKIQATNQNTDAYVIKVLGAGITSINSEGTFTFPMNVQQGSITVETSDWGTLKTPVVYGNVWNATKPSEVASQIKAETHDPITLTKKPQDILHYSEDSETQGFYVIPQAITPLVLSSGNQTGSYLKVIYQLIKKASQGGLAQDTQEFPIGDNNIGKYGSALIPIKDAITFEPGKIYTFVINFLKTDKDNGVGFVDPNPTDNGNSKGDPKGDGGGDPNTTDDKGDNPDIAKDPANGKPFPKPIKDSKKIKFIVSIEDFANAPVINIDL